MADSNDLDRRLSAANPLPDGIASTEATRARLDEIRRRARSGPRADQPQRSRLRPSIAQRMTRRGVVIASAVSVIAVGGAAAAATVLTSETVGAPGFCQTIISQTSNIPFPAGDQAGRNWALLESVGPKAGTTMNQLCDGNPENVADEGHPGTSAVSAHSEQVWFVWGAFCAWTHEWLTAEEANDTATASAAGSEISGALNWQASQDVDPQPTAGSNGGSQLGWLIPAQEAVSDDNLTDVKSLFDPQALSQPPAGFYAGGACVTVTPPPDSNGGTVVPGQASAQ